MPLEKKLSPHLIREQVPVLGASSEHSSESEPGQGALAFDLGRVESLGDSGAGRMKRSLGSMSFGEIRADSNDELSDEFEALTRKAPASDSSGEFKSI